MKKLILTLGACCLLQGTGLGQEVPQTPKGTDSKTYHGITVPEPYGWLEEAQNPKVKAWIELQNSYAENQMSQYSGREEMAQRIGELSLTPPTRFSPRLASSTLLFMKDSPPAPQPVLMSQAWPGGQEKVLVNTNKDEHPSAVTDFWPSPSGKYVAYGTAVGGSELTTIFFVETSTGRKLKDVLPSAAGGTTPPALAWDADEKGVTYVRLPKDSLFDASLFHHKLGSDSKTDTAAFGQGLSPVAEWDLSSSPDGSMAAALVHFGDGAPYRLYFRSPKGWSKAAGPEADIRGGGRWMPDGILAVTHKDAPRGEVRVYHPDGTSKVLIPQSQWAVKDVYPIKDGVLVARVWGEEQRLEHWNGLGQLVRVVPLPSGGIGLGGVASSSSSQDALITYDGWTTPLRWVSYNAQNGQLKTIFEVPTVGDFSQIEVTRTEAVSKDGSRVPLSIIHHKSVTPNGERPTILYAYGGFGVIQQAKYLGPTLAWLERGGVYAVANIRGGGEFGEAWHQDGMTIKKQNVFDDFYASAQALQEAGWTNSKKLGIMGGSNGGLLVAASLIQHPDAFKAVVGLVGVYDSLGHEGFPNGRYNVPEFGSSKVPEEFQAILAYSPLQNVKEGTNYPAVLLQTGENDLRVAPWQTRKFGAALQAATTSGEPVLLVTQTDAGHGQGASFSQKVGKTALALSFFAHHLGLPKELGADK
jgi:prolyl oligopeptidase